MPALLVVDALQFVDQPAGSGAMFLAMTFRQRIPHIVGIGDDICDRFEADVLLDVAQDCGGWNMLADLYAK